MVDRRAAVAALSALLAAVAVLLVPAAGAEPGREGVALEQQPGFFDFGALELFGRDDLEIHISVKGPLLQLVAEASRQSEPELARVLAALHGIEVQVFRVAEGERPEVAEALDATARALERQGWDAAITVRVDRDRGYAFLRMAGGEPVGLAAMYVTDDDQAVFVNIVGPIDPVAIGRLSARFDLALSPVPAPPGE